jgi:AbrB family looped-hinge helix DNA binding protein
MARSVTIDSAGRLVVPRDVRARLRLTAGTRLQLREEADRIVLVPEESLPATLEKAGILVFTGELSGTLPDHRDDREERLARLAEEA